MEARYDALVKVFNDPEEASKLFAMSPEDAQQYLKEKHGLEFSVDELNEVANGIRKGMSDDDTDELNEEALQLVAGGAKGGAYYTGYYIGKGIKVVGAGVGIAAGLVALGLISW